MNKGAWYRTRRHQVRGAVNGFMYVKIGFAGEKLVSVGAVIGFTGKNHVLVGAVIGFG